MTSHTRHPVLVLLASHWLSLCGIALVTTAVFCWLMLAGAAATNEYIGIITFFLLPFVFFLGLGLMPLGAWLAKRKIRGELDALPDRRTALQRLGIFFAGTTLVNLVLATQFTYRAVEHMETVGFCGQTCHMMEPQLAAYGVATHNRVPCVECHVAPGATGWLQAKASGTRQLIETIAGTYPRPVPSASETGKLIESSKSCERCHSRTAISPPRVHVRRKYAEDEKNTLAYTAWIPRVGGVGAGGIHGAHLDPNIEIRYRPTDRKRRTIPWVSWRDRRTGEVREYRMGKEAGAKGESREEFAMQCADCHNRPAHTFELPDRALDQALGSGVIDPSLSSVKKNALAALQGSYGSQAEADRAIRAAFATQYPGRPEGQTAAAAVSAIYARNVFPELKVTWGVYANNLGHTEFPGCFRCHDSGHQTSSGKEIGQDCASCHELLAVDETNPDILEKLNLKGKTQ